jgi:hypothetical protein
MKKSILVACFAIAMMSFSSAQPGGGRILSGGMMGSIINMRKQVALNQPLSGSQCYRIKLKNSVSVQTEIGIPVNNN